MGREKRINGTVKLKRSMKKWKVLKVREREKKKIPATLICQFFTIFAEFSMAESYQLN